MDQVLAKFGAAIPLMTFLALKSISPQKGAPAFTKTLKTIGFGKSMSMGVVVLLAGEWGLSHFFESSFKHLVIKHMQTLLDEGNSPEDITKQINQSSWLSR